MKNAVRFNAKGNFTQSVDKRRLGMQPAKMRNAIEGASGLLKGKTEVRTGDWLETLADAGPGDFSYMDPPCLGTSIGKDRRYAEWMSQERLVGGLRSLNARGVRFALSYDGMCGDKVYGPPLPDDLGMTRLHLHAGRSSQATLNGGTAETVESLYLSEGLARPEVTVLKRGQAQTAPVACTYARAGWRVTALEHAATTSSSAATPRNAVGSPAAWATKPIPAGPARMPE